MRHQEDTVVRRHLIERFQRVLGRLAPAAVLVLSAAFLASCGPAEADIAPPVEIPEEFSTSGGMIQSARWWEDLKDPVLDSLVNQALGANLNLRATWGLLAAADAAARAEGASRYPSLNFAGSGGVQQQKSDNAALDGSSVPFSLALSAGYEVDLWGRVGASIEAAEFERAASREDLSAAAISVSGQVASTWYGLVSARRQLQILREQLVANEATLQLVMARFRRGQVGAEDVLQQEQAVESRRGELARAEASVASAKHQLAVLLGLPPNTDLIPEGGELPRLGDVPDAGLPANLVTRRPDVRSAWYGVLAADRQVAVAVARRFPRLSISAQFSTSSDGVDGLFKNWLASLATNLTVPIIDGGQLRANADAARAAASASLNRYGQTVLEAFAEVEDALVEERTQAEYVASLRRQTELAGLVLERTRQNYLNGSGTYLNVLSAQQSHQSLQRSLIEAERARVAVRISLHRALAGGWEMTGPSGRNVTTTQTN